MPNSSGVEVPVTATVSHRFRGSAPPPPSWQAPLVAIVTTVLALIFSVFNVAHPDVWVRVTLIAVTGVIVPLCLLLRHALSGSGFLAAVADALQTIASAISGRLASLGPQPNPADVHPTLVPIAREDGTPVWAYWDAKARTFAIVTVASPPAAGARSTDATVTWGSGHTSSAASGSSGKLHDPARLRLGRLPRRDDPRTLRLERYLLRAFLPAGPDHIDPPSLSWGMMRNDRIGDCTCAAAGHLDMLWTAAIGALWTPSDDQVLAMYSAVSGFDPATGANDNGAVELDVLNYWRSTGLAGHKLAAYAALNLADHEQVKSAVALFGGTYMGVNLPISAQDQAVWDVPAGGLSGAGAPGSWGGHAIPYVGYNSTGPICITWAQPKQLTWAFHDAYVEEGYGLVSPDYVRATGVDPAGFSLAQLLLDVASLSSSPAGG